LIRINSTKSPFLGNRLFKYFNFKGLEDFEESSKDAFVDWLVKAANGAFPDFKEFHIAGALDSIKKLAYSKRIQKEDMIIFYWKSEYVRIRKKLRSCIKTNWRRK